MSCSNAKCVIKTDDLMVVCWLCEKVWHVKCCGLSVLAHDVLSRNNGVRWCCTDCRGISVKFYRFFKECHSEISGIGDDLSALRNRFDKFGQLTSSYSELDKVVKTPVVPSPKRKKSGRKLAVPTSNVNANPNTVDSGGDNLNSPIPSDTASEVVPPLHSTRSFELSPHVLPSTGAAGPFSAVLPSTSSAASSGTDVRKPRSLKIVPPRRTIFATRFAPETSVEDITFHIKSKITDIEDLSCYKLGSSSRICSFKIIVPEESFSELLDVNFWPPKAFVREFVYRENERRNDLASLPSRDRNVPKN